MKIQIRIDRLVIENAPGERLRPESLEKAIETELSRRISDSGLPTGLHGSSLSAFARHQATAPIEGSNSSDLGRDIGGVLYGGLDS